MREVIPGKNLFLFYLCLFVQKVHRCHPWIQTVIGFLFSCLSLDTFQGGRARKEGLTMIKQKHIFFWMAFLSKHKIWRAFLLNNLMTNKFQSFLSLFISWFEYHFFNDLLSFFNTPVLTSTNKCIKNKLCSYVLVLLQNQWTAVM